MRYMRGRPVPKHHTKQTSRSSAPEGDSAGRTWRPAACQNNAHLAMVFHVRSLAMICRKIEYTPKNMVNHHLRCSKSCFLGTLVRYCCKSVLPINRSHVLVIHTPPASLIVPQQIARMLLPHRAENDMGFQI